MKAAIFSLLFVAGCYGGDVRLEPTEATKQHQVTLCTSWDQSFCGLDVPAANELEAVRLFDDLSRDALRALDEACSAVLLSAHVTATPADDEHIYLVAEHCRQAHDFIDSFSSKPVVVPMTCAPSASGCPVTLRTCEGGSVTVMDATGSHTRETVVASETLTVVALTKVQLGNIATLSDVIVQGATTLADTEESCRNGIHDKLAIGTEREKALGVALAAFDDL